MSLAPHDRKTRLAIIASHPIQYQVPWFVALNAVSELDLKVFYTHLPTAEEQGIGFDLPFTWDLPIFEGYSWEHLPSAVRRPSLEGFFGNRLRRVCSQIAAWKPDVALLNGWHNLALLQVLAACVRLRIPRVVRGDSNALKARPWFAAAAHRSLLRFFDGFLVVGRSNRDFYRQNGVPESKIFRCPHFVENRRFISAAQEATRQREELRRRWGIASDHTCFLFAGKLIPKKRLFDLLEACRIAVERQGDVHLLVVGSGEQLEEAERRAGGLERRVTFAGFLNQSEMAEAYVASDCLVLPSDYGETWGLVVNEAMVCERPAIVSDRVGCGPDLVVEGETGFVFPFGDIEALAQQLAAAASDRERLRRMGKQARQLVVEEYSIEKAVKGTLEALAFLARH